MLKDAPAADKSASYHLDQRARDIFRDVVEAYLATGEPVGSRTLSRKGSVALSAASIRNSLADLVGMGLLDSPHVSAGRKPTAAGLRLFVDSLLQVGDLGEEEQRRIDGQLVAAGRSLEGTLSEASAMLSGLAGGAGLVIAPRAEAPLKHVEFLPLPPSQALAILVFEDGQVENRMLTVPIGLPPSSLQEASNFLIAHFKGRTLAQIQQEIGEVLRNARQQLESTAARLIEQGVAEWAGGIAGSQNSLIVRGRSNLFTNRQTEIDLEALGRLFDELETAQSLSQILDITREAEAVRIFIGAESPIFSLSGSSLIIAPYMNARRQVVGALGVIGPARLNYARIIPVVDYTARLIGRILDPGLDNTDTRR